MKEHGFVFVGPVINDTVSHSAPETGEKTVQGADGELTVYSRDIACTAIMSREQEYVLAVHIDELRHSLWRVILSYPPFISGICELAREMLPVSGSLTAALDAMILAARKLRDRDLQIHRAQYESGRVTLTHALAEADIDNCVVDRMPADLVSIEAGEHLGLSMRIKLPPRGSLPFLVYAHGVRHEYQAFWGRAPSLCRPTCAWSSPLPAATAAAACRCRT